MHKRPLEVAHRGKVVVGRFEKCIARTRIGNRTDATRTLVHEDALMPSLPNKPLKPMPVIHSRADSAETDMQC